MNVKDIGNYLAKDSIQYKFLKRVYKFFVKNLRNQMMYQIYAPNNRLIKPNSKILIVAPHPDDEVIGCGGIIAKYGSQIDVLCINSSGVRYENDKNTAEEIANIRIGEFQNAMKHAGVRKFYIAKIWGVPPMFQGIKKNIVKYMNEMQWNQYDLIFIPHQYDGHREHRYVGNYLVPKILKKTGYKQGAVIVQYEVWGTLSAPNYFENITDYMEQKKQLIEIYTTRRNGEYAKRMEGLNIYRGLTANCEYAEAFTVLSIRKYLRRRDDRSWSR